MTDRLDREAVARILGRAQELEATVPDEHGGVDANALIDAAHEVGLDADAVRDSLAIERFTVQPPPPRALDRVAGPAELVVERELHVTVADTLAGMEAWLSAVHRLNCDQPAAGTLRARRRTDATARIGRLLAGWRGEGRLGGVHALEVEAVPQVVGSTPAQPRTLARVRADRSGQRTLRLGGGGAAGIVGAGTGVVTVATGSAIMPIVPLVSVPLVLGGLLVARSGRGQSDRLELELERLLSRVDRGERPTGLLTRVARRARDVAVQGRRG